MNNYTINDIESLSFKDGVRQRIAMYLGSADMQGVYNAIQEIISNSVDEYYMGYGNKIEIGLGPDNMVVVTDKGRGIPFGIKEDGSNVLVDIFSRAHTGGKFNDKVYNSVAGLNGIGAKATCLSSLKFNVSVVRDGKHAVASWEKGDLISYKEEDWDNTEEHGTSIQFAPDPEVYNVESIDIKFEELCKKCKNLSYLTKGLTFSLENSITNEKVEYCAKDGLIDLIKDNVKEPVHPTPIYFELKDGDEQVEIALQWTKGREHGYTFTNGLYHSEGGTSQTGLKTAITNFMKKQIKSGMDGEMARTGLIYAVACKTPNPSFANQTKTKINNTSLRGLAQKATTQALENFKNFYPNEFDKILNFLLKEKKAEEAAEKARNAVLNAQKQLSVESKKKTIVADKLADCKYHDERSSLYICEGDSACGSIKLARNSDFVAAMPIRGKIINALKNPLDEVLENEEVQAINKVLGCGILDHINISKMRYGKVFFAADADPDGNSIVCLLLVLFYKMWPELIKAGRVYWAQFPLYEITVGKTKYFAYNDEELQRLPKGKVSRNKGLGEMDPDDFERAAFSDEARAIRFTMDDVEEAKKILEVLLGNENEARSKYIFENVDFTTVEGE